MRLKTYVKFAGVLVAGFLLLLAISYRSYLLKYYAFQALATIFFGTLIWCGIKIVLLLTMLILILSAFLLHAFFEVQPRDHHHLMPIFALLAALGILQEMGTGGSPRYAETS